ncbi:ribulose-phosphate 3-epimerase [Clostridiisalibacter paucivorans]|uniref:ribulose-phosphate 3-epimerase n=1 Tax=Clostridiisalibacter paucivorans TaxID=408753 RepID=UPI000479DE5F|nr:ribulose-phosphate 3-epimerase [Clostridiisalibacter paucivorans]
MIKIAPSILSADFSNLYEQIKYIEKGGADLIHLDIMDGVFVPNITFGAPVIKSIRKVTDLPFDVHLMIDKPERYIDDFVAAGADIITVHQESTIHLHRTVQMIKNSGIKAAVALNPATPLESIYHVLPDIDMVLIMTVNPGFGGQKLINNMERKVRNLRDIINREGLDIDIQVDGGIKLDNINRVMDWGANVFVAGSAVFKADNILEAVKEFKHICKE